MPQAMDGLPRALAIANIRQYERDVADARAVYTELTRRRSDLTVYGNICFDSRTQYINFP